MTSTLAQVGTIGFWVSLGAYICATVYGLTNKRHRLAINSIAQVTTIAATACCVVLALTKSPFWWVTAAIWFALFLFTATVSRRSIRDLIRAEADLAAVNARIDAFLRRGGVR